MIYLIVSFSITLKMTVKPDFKAHHYSTLNISETIQDRYMVITDQ